MNHTSRKYNPQIGRFLSVDPLFEAFPNQSPYSYSFNNPLSFKDPSGLAPEKEKGGGMRLQGDVLGPYNESMYRALCEFIVRDQNSSYIFSMMLVKQFKLDSDEAFHRLLLIGKEAFGNGGGGGGKGSTESGNGATSDDNRKPGILKKAWGWFKGLFSKDENKETEENVIYKHVEGFVGIPQSAGSDGPTCGFANISGIAKSKGMDKSIDLLIKEYEIAYPRDKWRDNGGAKGGNLVTLASQLQIFPAGFVYGQLNENTVIDAIDNNEVVFAGMSTIIGHHFITFTGYQINANGERNFEYWDSRTERYEFMNSFYNIQPLNDNIFGARYYIPKR